MKSCRLGELVSGVGVGIGAGVDVDEKLVCAVGGDVGPGWVTRRCRVYIGMPVIVRARRVL